GPGGPATAPKGVDMSRSHSGRGLACLTGFLAIPLLALLPTTAASAATTGHLPAAPSRIQRIQPAARIPAGATSLGAVSATASVTGAVVLKPRDEAAVKAFIKDVTDKKSPEFHHYLSAGAYAAQFGPAPETIASVNSTLQSEGLTVTSVASD